MQDVPYDEWFDFIESFIAVPCTRPLIELFCGPGRLTDLARQAGYAAFALDNHLAFLKDTGGFRIAAHANFLPFRERSIAGLFAANSAINYLADGAELLAHLADCRRVLADDGFYVFDVCSEERAHALSQQTLSALNGKVTFSHSYAPPQKIMETTVRVVSGEKNIAELHRQRIFTESEIRNAARQANFRITDCAENYGASLSAVSPPIITWVLTANDRDGRSSIVSRRE